jgi:polysaccharide export outer membrane protein
VIGAVARPGVYEIRPNARVSEGIALAGGPRTFDAEGESHELADLAGARVIRGGAALPISLGRALEGDPRHDVRLRAGDLLCVPPARGLRVVVLGEVRSPRVLPFRRGLRLTEALALSGGTTKDADGADVRVVRGPLSAPRVYRADLDALIAGDRGDVELAPGDIVFVTEHWFATTTDVINRLTPALTAGALTAALLQR